jgi:hypothetical protein
MINQLLIFRFTKNIFLQLGPIIINSILYVNLNSFVIFYIKCYFLYQQIWCFQNFTKLTMKNDTKPKNGGGKLLPHFPPNPCLEWQQFKIDCHMFLYIPIINLFTCPILFCLHVQSLCCLHVPLKIPSLVIWILCSNIRKNTNIFLLISMT